jgi:hypothetical protein
MKCHLKEERSQLLYIAFQIQVLDRVRPFLGMFINSSQERGYRADFVVYLSVSQANYLLISIINCFKSAILL